MLLSRPKLNRMVPSASSRGTPMATSTCEGSTAPVEQADPLDAAMPARSRCISSASLSAPCTAMLKRWGARSLPSALTTRSGTVALSRRGQLVPQRHRALAPGPLLRGGQLHRPPQGHGAGHVLGTRADPELLAAAVDDGLDRLAVPHDQGADTLGRPDLVTRDGEQGAAEALERHRHLAHCLDRVGVEDDAGIAASLGDLCHRLDHADLVVDPHDRDHRRHFGQCAVQRIQLEHAGAVHRQQDLSPAQVTHGMRRGQHRLVLDRRDRGAHRPPRSRAASAAPTMPRLSASVPPEVKTTWSGSAPSASAICRRACSMPARAARPKRWALEGLPKDWSVR